ncbi:MAG TPA: integration host factor subunit beta [Bacteroidetes bacterium]|nr:integration host factor subunit beta [Bacteroidota bacterium]HIL56428.1 integration host factor subunit beta [Rhodothermales bacterium]
MTKAQIVDQIAEATGLTKIETEAVVDGFMHTVIEAVVDGEGVELRGFGSFRAQERAARTARNPRTNEPVPVAARTLPVFKPAAEFKRRVQDAHAE